MGGGQACLESPASNQSSPEPLSACTLVLKKVKHRLVENMSSGTADALGLSRAILCNGETSHPSLSTFPGP